jgi:hypothetical protein
VETPMDTTYPSPAAQTLPRPTPPHQLVDALKVEVEAFKGALDVAETALRWHRDLADLVSEILDDPMMVPQRKVEVMRYLRKVIASPEYDLSRQRDGFIGALRKL